MLQNRWDIQSSRQLVQVSLLRRLSITFKLTQTLKHFLTHIPTHPHTPVYGVTG